MLRIHKCMRILAIVASMTTAVAAEAGELSANIGWNSEYIFRGVSQSDSSTFAGLDIEQSGFYLGTWLADVGEGLEADLYGGYSGEWADFRYAVGVTAYLYTDDFDDEYFELNLIGGYGYVSADIAIGRYDNFAGPTLDYQYYTVGVEHRDFYASISLWGDDYDGEVFELGYNNTLSIDGAELFEFGIAVINSNDVGVRSSFVKDDETSLVLRISKAFGTE